MDERFWRGWKRLSLVIGLVVSMAMWARWLYVITIYGDSKYADHLFFFTLLVFPMVWGGMRLMGRLLKWTMAGFTEATPEHPRPERTQTDVQADPEHAALKAALNAWRRPSRRRQRIKTTLRVERGWYVALGIVAALMVLFVWLRYMITGH
jgi:hypothetical protein